MKKLKTTLTSVILVAAFVISEFSNTASAAPISKTHLNTASGIQKISSLTQRQKISTQKLVSLTASNSEKHTTLPKLNKPVAASNLTTSAVMPSSTNQPTAGFGMGADNPSSEINGNYTTQTKVDVLVSSNTDGSTSYESQNLPKDIGYAIYPQATNNYTAIPLVDSNNNLVGIQFQFNSPAQYVVLIEAENSSGVWSNPIYPVINIEPTSGSRPTASLDHPITSLVPQNIAFNVSWTSSQAQNKLSTLKDSQIIVLNSASTDDDQAYEITPNSATDFSNWLHNISIADDGIYYVLLNVEDSNGYWSNWQIAEVEIETSSVQVINPSVTGDEGNVNWNMGLYASYRDSLSMSGILVDSSGYELPYVALNMNVNDYDSNNSSTSPIFYTSSDGSFNETMTNLPTSYGELEQVNYESDDYYDDASLNLSSGNVSLYSTGVYGFAYWIYTGE